MKTKSDVLHLKNVILHHHDKKKGRNLTDWKKKLKQNKNLLNIILQYRPFNFFFYLHSNLFVLQGPVDPFKKSEKKNEKAEDGLEESVVGVGYVKTGMIIFSYLTDFSYFPLKNKMNVAGLGQNK